MVEVYTRPLQERFVASRCSVAYLFRVCWYIALVIPPVYIAYSTGAFWRREDRYLEQPLVMFTKQIIVIAQAADGTRVLQYSTMERFNYLTGYANIRQPSLKSWPTDLNLDAKPDIWDINLVFPLYTTDLPIVAATVLAFFRVNYKTLVNLEMNAMVQVQKDGGVQGNHWMVAGDLEFFQRNPLSRTSGLGTRHVYEYPVLNDTTIVVLDDTDLGNIMLKNEARNETLHLDARHVWSRTAASSFNLTMHLNVPTTTVSYIPSAGEAIKFAYIQWLAMFWLMYFGLKFVREFVFAQNIVDTQRIQDGTPVAKLHQF